MKSLLCRIINVIVLSSFLLQGGIVSHAEATVTENVATGNTGGNSCYVNMQGDFTDRTQQPEHRQWIQGCRDTYGSGICGCKSTRETTEPCWSKMLMSSQTIASGGCVMMSVCMLMVESGVITDTNWTPDEYIEWGHNNGLWSGNMILWNAVNKFSPNLTGINVGKTAESNGGYVQDGSIAKIEKLLNKGYFLIGRVKNDAHTVFILGTAVNPTTGEKDAIMCDPGTGNKSMFVKDKYPNGVEYLGVFKVTDCTPYATSGGMSNNSDSTNSNAENTQNSTSIGSLIYEDDIPIEVQNVDMKLTNLSDNNKNRLLELRQEIELIKENKAIQKVNILGKVLGVIIFLYTALYMVGYIHDLNNISEIDMLNVITLGRESLDDSKQHKLKHRSRIIKIVLGLLIGIILFNMTGLVSLLYRLYMLFMTLI